MVVYLIGGLVVFVGLIILARWFVSAEPRTVLRALRNAALVLLALFVGLMAVTGRWQLLPMLLLLLLPWFNRFNVFRNMRKNASGPTPGGTSDVETDFLHMTLDHDTGTMTGAVRAGRFAGRRVEELALGEVLALHRECAADPQSLSVLEAYLDRQFGDRWREAASAARTGDGAGGDGQMTADEAYKVLGLEPGASRDDIERAYRRMMQNFHPDRGGSDYLAAKINQAKNLLLGMH